MAGWTHFNFCAAVEHVRKRDQPKFLTMMPPVIAKFRADEIGASACDSMV
jgi:hypothetical protein